MEMYFVFGGKKIPVESQEKAAEIVEFVGLYKKLIGDGGDIIGETTAQPDDVPATAPPAPSPRSVIPPPGKKIADYALRVLEGAGPVLKLDDLREEMQRIGWVGNGDTKTALNSSITRALVESRGRFTKLPGRRWTISAPATAP